MLDLRQQALAAARGLSSGEGALVEVLRDLEQERSRAAQAYRAVVRSLAAALEARDGYTGEHSDDVHALTVAVARRLGLDARATAEVEAVALLHDVGKIGIPDHVLHKPGPLTEAEWELMRQHPAIGERILRPLPGLSAVATAVRHEHERWDGGGYPDGLAGEAIPLASRIVLACDAYNALVSDRPYRKALSDDVARIELRRCAGTQFDPDVVDALIAVLDDPQEIERSDGFTDDLARALTAAGPGVDGDDHRHERELHALIAISSAVAAAHRLEDVVEVAADEACAAIDATSLAISRWEVQGRILRTLVNAGQLGEGEERLPADETYRLEGADEEVRALLESGQSFRCSLGDPDVPAIERELLEAAGREHCIGVPILFAGRPWGELWATRCADCPPFDDREARFLTTVAGQVASAVGRAELFSHMAELAFADPLTGVANRRALDERLELAVADTVAGGGDLAILLCDVDNLKELNDRHGHQAGDEALVRVARTLQRAAGDAETTLVARVGGDEFCVLLEDGDEDAATTVGERVLALLRHGDGPQVTVSCGVASVGLGAQRAGDLLRMADAAQYTAKRSGRSRVCVADNDLETTWRASSAERRAIRGRKAPSDLDVGALLQGALDTLDGPLANRPALDRLEAIALGCAAALDASAAVVSWRGADAELIDTVFTSDRRTGRTSGERFGTAGEKYETSRYPATERALRGGGTFVVVADDPAADPAERALLAEWGMAGVLGAAAIDGEEGSWLVELYADGRTRPLADAVPALRLLVAEAVRRASPVTVLRAA